MIHLSSFGLLAFSVAVLQGRCWFSINYLFQKSELTSPFVQVCRSDSLNAPDPLPEPAALPVRDPSGLC